MERKTLLRYKRRWLFALAPCLLFCFMYGVWGSMEVYTGSASNFRFTYYEALIPLAPGIIMDAGLITVGAISFLHNVMREIFSSFDEVDTPADIDESPDKWGDDQWTD